MHQVSNKLLSNSFVVMKRGVQELMVYGIVLLSNCSATSVDVEEHLYRLAKDSGITVVTSSQVCMAA